MSNAILMEADGPSDAHCWDYVQHLMNQSHFKDCTDWTEGHDLCPYYRKANMTAWNLLGLN